MFKFKPIHGIAVVAAVVLGGVVLGSGGAADPHQRVTAGKDGAVRIGIADLHPEQVRFYRYLNASNQEVDFFIGRDGEGTVQAAFDASENHHKLRRGFRFENGWIVDNKCGSTMRLSAVNAGGGGCSPVPLRHQVVGDEVRIAQEDLLQEWRLFH